VETNGSRPMHVIRILDSTGDTRLSFDPSDPAAVAEVEARFKELMERNFVAFDVSAQPGRIVTAFDPQATEVIVSHRFAGG
jgi:hypothetical protein